MAALSISKYIFLLVGTGIMLLFMFAAPGLMGAEDFIATNSTTEAYNMSADFAANAYDTPTPFLEILIYVIAGSGVVAGIVWFRSLL